MKKGKKFNMVASIILAVFGPLVMTEGATAVDYPNRPVRMIVSFPPGGAADSCSKIVAKRASEFLGQPIVSEYKPGGGGTIAAAYVAKSKPDGYTLWLGSTSAASVAPLVKTNPGYTMEDFVHISGYAMGPQMINAKKGGRWNTLHEFIADAKQNPGKYTYTTPAALGLNHLIIEALCKKAGIKLTFVPFPGAAEANAALLGGHVDITCTGGTMGLYEGGRLNVLAISEEKRLKFYPEIPTLTELGYPIVISCLYFLSIPRGTPQEVIDKLYDAHKKAFARYGEEIAALLTKIEMFPSFLNHEEVRKWHHQERGIFYETAKELGVLANP